MTDIQNAIVEINQRLKEFCKELHTAYECTELFCELTAYECTELFCELHKKYGFEFEINPYSKAVGSVGSNFPYVYGQCVEWIRFHYSFFRKDGLIEYKMYLE